MAAVYHGVSQNEDLSPGLIKKDTKTTGEAIRDMTFNHAGEIQMGMGASIIVLPFFGFAILAEFIFIISLLYLLYSKSKVKVYTFRAPISIDENGNRVGDGLMLLGNEGLDKKAMWFSDDELRTHMLVFGTTGSGKTRFLLGLLYQSLMFGSGCLMVDGKGDNTVWWLVFSFCRKIDKVDDLLVINYLTGEDDTQVGSAPTLKRKTNTSNPFAYGSSEQLRSLIVGLMRDGGGDDMWKGRASAMLGSLLKVLTEMRNRGDINLDIDKIRDYMPLDRIIELSQKEDDLSESTIDSIKKYLADLPGYREEDALMDSVEQKAYEQHGYLTMQLTEIMADLAETYGSIFSAELGEVDYKDVVFNRRCLFVILPSLEKDPDALAGLGKLCVAGVRSALAPALGDELEGLKINVIDKKPTKCSVPFLMIMDEYGYYAVKGFAVVAAQARSLGVAVVFAGQDYQSLKKASEEEAAATVANTNIKICMKLEDPKETLQIMQDRAGEAYLAKLPGHENSQKTLGALYKEMKNTQIDLVKRMSLRDLVNQAPGEAHIMNADKLARGRLYFADPDEVDEAKINKFIMVKKPSKNTIDKYNKVNQKLIELWESESEPDLDDNSDDGVNTILADMLMGCEHTLSFDDSSVFAIGLDEIRAQMKDEIMDAKSIEDNLSDEEKEIRKRKEEIEVKRHENNEKAKEILNEGSEPSGSPMEIDALAKELNMDLNKEMQGDELDEIIKQEEEHGILAAMDEGEMPSDSLKEQADKFQSKINELTEVIEESNISALQSDGATHEEKVRANPINRIHELDRMHGEGDADGDAVDVISRTVNNFSDYANEPNPKKRNKEDLTKELGDILNALDSRVEE